jgi:uncharacterized protein (DUF433 family)
VIIQRAFPLVPVHAEVFMNDVLHHIHLHDDGTLRIGRAGVPLHEFLAASNSCHSAKEVRELYPQLSEEEVEQAMTYSLHDPDEADFHLSEIGEYWKTHEL